MHTVFGTSITCCTMSGPVCIDAKHLADIRRVHAGSIEDEMKLLQNKKLTERQRAAAQLRFSEKVILQKTLDAVRR